MYNLEEILLTLNKDVNGFDIVCFPSEGKHFTLSQKEFKEEYPHHNKDLETLILKAFLSIPTHKTSISLI